MDNEEREKMSKTIVSIAGARPNFMKIAPIADAIKKNSELVHYLVHTGQHYDSAMSQVFFDELGIPRPDKNLEVGSAPRLEQIEVIMERFRPVIKEYQPDLVLVVGDVNSTIACARVAQESGIRVAHVEAGLRSFDRRMPEEINRIECDEISDYLFVTEQSGLDNLARESIQGEVFFVGNVMIDTLVKHLPTIKSRKSYSELELQAKEYFVATFHRPSNVDGKDTLQNLLQIVSGVCERTPLVIPLHPRTESGLKKHGLFEEFKSIKRLKLVKPLGYLDFMSLVSQSQGVLTDSGGLQEETTYLGIPCATLRENTERPVTISLGTNVLLPIVEAEVVAFVEQVLKGLQKKGEIPPLWDGNAAERIVAELSTKL